MRKLLTVCLALWTINSFAQHTLKGQVMDTLNQGLAYASVSLSNSADTSMVQFAVSDQKGSFAFKNVDSGNYLIITAAFAHDVEYTPLNLRSDTILQIHLLPSAHTIGEILVQAKNIPVIVSGDTVIYNADQFNTNSNATIEDLLQKLPGVEVSKDGSVSSQGQQISKVLINGKEFFGNNIQAATQNLDANLVATVEVIERKTEDDEFTGEEGNETEKVINVVLKEEHTRGYFGGFYAGYAPTEELYYLRGDLNFFRDQTQISFIGGGNNISESIFGWGDRLTLQNFEIIPFNYSNNWFFFNNEGITTKKGIGINLYTEPTKGMKLNMSYIRSLSTAYSLESDRSEVFIDTFSLFNQSETSRNNDAGQHQFNGNVQYEPDSLNRIVIRSQMTTNVSSAAEQWLAFNYTEAIPVLNSGVNMDQTSNNNYKFVNKVNWTRKSKKISDNNFNTSVYFGTSRLTDSTATYLKTAEGILLDYPSQPIYQLNQTLLTNENTLALTNAYQLKISKKFSIKPGVNWLISRYDHTYQWDRDGEPIEQLSPIGNVKVQNIEYYSHLIFEIDSVTNLRVVPELNQIIEQRSFATDSQYNYSYNQVYFIPYIFYRKVIPGKSRTHLSIRANVERPDLRRFLPIIDNSNPYITTVGNIELRNWMKYSNYFSYFKTLGLNKHFMIHQYSNYGVNPVTNKVTIDESNYRITEALNYKFNTYIGGGASMNWKIDKLDMSTSVGLSYNGGKSFYILNDEELEVTNSSPSVVIGFAFNDFDMWSMDFEYDFSFNRGMIGQNQNNSYLGHEVWFEFSFTPNDRLEWNTELDWTVMAANAFISSNSIALLHSDISYFIGKDMRWAVGIRAHDILNQNSNVWRYWTANSFIESRNNDITRYFGLTLRYKIKKPSKESDEKS